MAAIESADYAEARKAYRTDPIVQGMWLDVLAAHGHNVEAALESIAHDDRRTPRFEFMQQANRGYRQLGGEQQGHLGACAEAIIQMMLLLTGELTGEDIN